MSRSSQLLKVAADALNDGRDPLTTPFLDEHGVTFDECLDLAEWLAVGAQLVAWAIENPRPARTALSGAADAMKMDFIIRALSNMNEEARQ